MKPDRLLCYMFLLAILDLTDSIPIILNLLTNGNIALIYSVTTGKQKKTGLCTVRGLPIETAAPLFSSSMFAGFHNQCPTYTYTLLIRKGGNHRADIK